MVLRLFAENPRRPMAGTDIMKVTGLASGTLYTILLRFEQQGILMSEWETEKPEALGRPRRRAYTITPSGRTVAARALQELGVPMRGLSPAMGEA